jgi:hypothetical protein
MKEREQVKKRKGYLSRSVSRRMSERGLRLPDFGGFQIISIGNP